MRIYHERSRALQITFAGLSFKNVFKILSVLRECLLWINYRIIFLKLNALLTKENFVFLNHPFSKEICFGFLRHNKIILRILVVVSFLLQIFWFQFINLVTEWVLSRSRTFSNKISFSRSLLGRVILIGSSRRTSSIVWLKAWDINIKDFADVSLENFIIRCAKDKLLNKSFHTFVSECEVVFNFYDRVFRIWLLRNF